MPLATGLTNDEAYAVAERVLGEMLGSYAFDHAEVRSGPDHDGEDSLFVTAVLKPRADIVPPDVYAAAYGALDDALRAHGERRFSYFQVNRPDEPVGEAEDEA